MKGLAAVTLLRAIEKRAGKPIGALFDLLVGTSTGAVLALALGCLNYNLDQCEAIYTKLGQKVGAAWAGGGGGACAGGWCGCSGAGAGAGPVRGHLHLVAGSGVAVAEVFP